MSERKLINKYIPRDFDPTAIPKVRQPKAPGGNKLERSNIMLPLTCRCSNCNTILNHGKKFNGKKETLKEQFNGLPIIRLYFRCGTCSNQIAFRTDPQNLGYILESGAERLSDIYFTGQLNRAARREENVNPVFESNLDQIESRTAQSCQNAMELDQLEAMYEQERILAQEQRDDFTSPPISQLAFSATTNGAHIPPSSSIDLEHQAEEEYHRLIRDTTSATTSRQLAGDHHLDVPLSSDSDDIPVYYSSSEDEEWEQHDHTEREEEEGEKHPIKRQRTSGTDLFNIHDSVQLADPIHQPVPNPLVVQYATQQSIGLEDYSDSE